jgi:hypothetical protein
MSKQVPASISCPKCGQTSEISLYRSIWIEYPENRKLIFNNQINVFSCHRCGFSEKIPFSLLATNVKRHIAVWYEPSPDPHVESDMKQYAAQFGPKSFYAIAPRIRNWEDFKNKIVELEGRTGIKSDLIVSTEMQNNMGWDVGSTKERDKKAWWKIW